MIISASAAFSAGCAPRPWEREPARDAPRGPEILLIARGNAYGLFGHASLRLDGRMFSFWLIEGRLTLVVMRPEAFFHLYNDYEERDVRGLELEADDAFLDEVRARITAALRRPPEADPPYHVFRRNCVTGLVRLLAPSPSAARDLPPIHTTGALERWTRRHFRIAAERFYPSYRHRMMHEKLAEGEGLGREFFVPLAECDSHRYRCARLVYTEDLRGPVVLLRPLAGTANVAAGAFQAVKGTLGVPFGRMPDAFRGLYAVLLALPELVGLPVRFAGRPLPLSADRAEGPPPSWRPAREETRKEKGRRVRPSALGNGAGKRGGRIRPPLSPCASSRAPR